MQLRTVLFCSFLAVPALAACGDDTGGGTGGDGSTSGSSSTGTGTPASSGASNPSSSGAGGDPTGGGGDPTGGGGGPIELSCDTYCDTIMEACDDNIQYPDGDSCRAACETFGEGEYQDADASLGCHQYHADAALGDPDVHCIHAGPTGGDQCGTPCENFCQIAPGICPDVYSSTDVCEKICEGFTVGDFSVSPPATGDTLGCRMYHLTVAAVNSGNAEEHCPHTAADSDQCL